MTREIKSSKISEAVKNLCIKANTELNDDLLKIFKKFLLLEKSDTGKDVLRQIVENAEIAKLKKKPICQDCGFAVVFIELGQDVTITGKSLEEAVNDGVRQGYEQGFLRKSIVSDPFNRKNTEDNTPADIITEIVPGDKIRITLMAKGGGCENVTALRMFTPTAEFKEIADFVVEKIVEAGPNPCPPLIVGLGIGGTADKAMLLAKKALLRDIEEKNKDEEIAEKEKQLLEMINNSGVGPSGLGGSTTAIQVNIETYPCHIASLPVALCVDCHAHRVKRTEI